MSILPNTLFIEEAQDHIAKLTVLSLGLGQDSTALLYKYVYDKEFRQKYAPNDFIVIYCDTGNEFPETYKHNEFIKSFCKQHKIDYFVVEPSMGFHYNGWESLQNHFETYNSIMGTGLLRTCTDKLKVQPFHNFLEDYLSNRYKLPLGRKRAHKHFSSIHGPINILLGIASGEESRTRTKPFADKWKAQSIRHVYPLIDLKMDRAACQNYIKEVGHDFVAPSNCIMCPFCSHQELLYIYRFEFKQYLQWVEYERKKFQRDNDRGKDKVYGVKGKWIARENRPYTLVDALQEAKDRYGHLNDNELIEYRMSHGHCVQSTY